MSYTLPFPWFGGKTRVSDLVWSRLGNVHHYIEPFFGGGAVLFNRPHIGKVETINDLDGYVANFWRAVQMDPDSVARYADWPVNEVDLEARHGWLIDQRKTDFISRLRNEPDYYDPKIAGYWVWGLGCWIGGKWCAKRVIQKPQISHRKGIHKHSISSMLNEYMTEISKRLRHVTVLCGDWKRAVTPGAIGLEQRETNKKYGIFLDPPYSDLAGRDKDLYRIDSMSVAHRVREWCLANQDDTRLRIALCGYEGEHDMPGWEVVEWKAQGGHGKSVSQGQQE